MKSRVVLFFITFGVAFLAVLARLFYIQCLPNQALERLKKSQYQTVISLPAQRGKIIDRKGEELATSVTAQSLYVDPSRVDSPKKLSKKLASLLGEPAREIYQILNTSRKFSWLKRRLDPDLVEEVKSWEEPSLHFVEEGRRAYPNKTLLSQTLGFVGTDGEGLEGLEKKYDTELKGERQSFLSRRDARGRPLVVNGQIFELHADGDTLETTIDKDLQYELERELETVTESQGADKATGVVMDPATGEILAMASFPTFDPGNPGHANPDNRRNRPINDIYEPGSTFKIVTVAAALRTGRILPNTKYFCENGKFKIGKHTIHEALSTEKFEWMSVSQILAVSSNIGSAKIAFDVGQPAFTQMIKDFGFGMRTGVDLGGESGGLLVGGTWPELLFSNIAFGQGIGVTALQMANAYSAVANGGKLMKPYVVKRILDSDQHLVFERSPEIVRQVLSPKEASMMTLMLSGTTTAEGGTGKSARVDGYPVAGKTGTAQKVNPNGRGYMSNEYISSFAGFVPANNPQFTIYIAVDNPRKHHFGADVAAPIFTHLASFALNQKGFMPIVVSENDLMPTKNGNYVSGSAVGTALPGRGHGVGGGSVDGSVGNGNGNGNASTLGADVVLGINSQVIKNDALNGVMPKLTGLTVHDVGRVLREYEAQGTPLGGNVELVGTGLVESQWPLPGQKVKKDQKIKVVFHSSG